MKPRFHAITFDSSGRYAYDVLDRESNTCIRVLTSAMKTVASFTADFESARLKIMAGNSRDLATIGTVIAAVPSKFAAWRNWISVRTVTFFWGQNREHGQMCSRFIAEGAWTNPATDDDRSDVIASACRKLQPNVVDGT